MNDTVIIFSYPKPCVTPYQYYVRCRSGRTRINHHDLTYPHRFYSNESRRDSNADLCVRPNPSFRFRISGRGNDAKRTINNNNNNTIPRDLKVFLSGVKQQHHIRCVCARAQKYICVCVSRPLFLFFNFLKVESNKWRNKTIKKNKSFLIFSTSVSFEMRTDTRVILNCRQYIIIIFFFSKLA